ncbi:hypothetical protein LINPERHAP1_LOCUS32351 [Linum perenne]
MNTTTSSFIILIIILLFNTLENDVVRCDDPNVTYVLSLCNEFTADDTGLNSTVLEAIVMEAIDDAVYYYQGPGEKATCTEIPFDSDISFFASAMCWGDISFEDCRNCLWNAQYSLVDHLCPSRIGGRLILTNCFLRYEMYRLC